MTYSIEQKAREDLASLCHAQWSGWMKYLFSKCQDATETGATIIHPDYENRWVRQMNTPYADLSEEEKESDRKEADRFMPYILAALAEGERRERDRWDRLDSPDEKVLRERAEKAESALAAATAKIKELETALSGRTVSCGNCNVLAEKLSRYEQAGPGDEETKDAVRWAEDYCDNAISVTSALGRGRILLRALRAAWKDLADARKRIEEAKTLMLRSTTEEMGGLPDLFQPKGGWGKYDEDVKDFVEELEKKCF